MSSELILAADGVQERFFKNNQTALKELIGDIGDDLQNLRKFSELLNKLVKTSTSTAPAPFENQGSVLVAPSPLYENVYYAVECYDELYRKDLDALMYALASRMGAKSYQSSFEMQVERGIDKSYLNKIKGKGVKSGVLADLKANIKFEKSQQYKEVRKEDFSEQGKKPQHCSPDELRGFIASKKINLTALPPKFADKVKLYLDGKDIAAAEFKNTEEVSISSKNLTEFSLDLHLNVIAAADNIVVDDFAAFSKKQSFEYASKVSYSIVFAPKGE